jgi:hypothetical protein
VYGRQCVARTQDKIGMECADVRCEDKRSIVEVLDVMEYYHPTSKGVCFCTFTKNTHVQLSHFVSPFVRG